MKHLIIAVLYWLAILLFLLFPSIVRCRIHRLIIGGRDNYIAPNQRGFIIGGVGNRIEDE